MSNRTDTRDLLLNCGCNSYFPVYPHNNQISTATLLNQLFSAASVSGYNKEENEFVENFGNYFSKGDIIFNEFPPEGEENKLYCDTQNKKIYYWDNEYLLLFDREISFDDKESAFIINCGTSTEVI